MLHEIFLFDLLLFLRYNPQVYLLGYGAKLFRFNFGGSDPHDEASQKSGVSSAESITGRKRNLTFSLHYHLYFYMFIAYLPLVNRSLSVA